MQDVQTSFAIGCSLALLWEAPLSAPGWRDDPTALLRLLRPQAALLLAVWCCWDGIIFLVRAQPPAPGSVVSLWMLHRLHMTKFTVRMHVRMTTTTHASTSHTRPDLAPQTVQQCQPPPKQRRLHPAERARHALPRRPHLA